MLLKGILPIAMSLSAIGGAHAADPAKIHFNIGVQDIGWTLPTGYCLPQGAMVAAGQLVAAADDVNVTHALAIDCKQASLDGDYIILKTPRQALLPALDRAELLTMLGKEFDSPAFAEAMKDGKIEDRLKNNFSQILGTGVDTESVAKPLGRDDVCAYVGGHVVMNVPEKKISTNIAFATCITTVSRKVLSLNAYSPYRQPSDIAALVVRARDYTKAMIAENEGATAKP